MKLCPTDFGKAIYLGVEPLVAVVDGMDGFIPESSGNWELVANGVVKLELDATARHALLSKSDRASLANRFGASPLSSYVVRFQAVELEDISKILKPMPVLAILCLSEPPAGGGIIVNQIGRIWPKMGRLIIVKNSLGIKFERIAASECHHLVMSFDYEDPNIL